MKWSKAIKEIEKIIADGKVARIVYHRKWARNSYYLDRRADVRADGIVEYEWNGKTEKAIHTDWDQVDEGSWIIDIVEAKEEQR